MSYDTVTHRRRGYAIQREPTAGTPVTSPPGLTAALIYLRPVPRARLLAMFADLGVFVREYQALPVIELWTEGQNCDLALVVGGNDPSHIAATARIVSAITPAVVVLVPDSVSGEVYRATGVIATLSDDEVEASLVSAVAAAAKRARNRRESGVNLDTVLVGDVRFAVAAGRLECNGRMLGLSPVEQKILRRLSASPGVPVSAQELEGEVKDTRETKHGSELRATILRIRRKLEQVGGNPLLLGTVRGFGYVLVR